MKLSPKDQAVYKVHLRVAGAILRRAKTPAELTLACDRLDALEKGFAKRQLLSIWEWEALFRYKESHERVGFTNPHWLPADVTVWMLQAELESMRQQFNKQHPGYPHGLIFRWELPEPVVVPVKLTFIQKVRAWLKRV